MRDDACGMFRSWMACVAASFLRVLGFWIRQIRDSHFATGALAVVLKPSAWMLTAPLLRRIFRRKAVGLLLLNDPLGCREQSYHWLSMQTKQQSAVAPCSFPCKFPRALLFDVVSRMHSPVDQLDLTVARSGWHTTTWRSSVKLPLLSVLT
jgi:hypothetical protein